MSALSNLMPQTDGLMHVQVFVISGGAGHPVTPSPRSQTQLNEEASSWHAIRLITEITRAHAAPRPAAAPLNCITLMEV